MSKFREHLSLNLQPGHLDIPIERSRFSPASTIDPSPRYSENRSPLKRTPLSPKDIEAGTPSSSSTLRDKFTRLFFDLRTGSSPYPHDQRMTQWPPLNVEKRRCTCHVHDPRHDAKVKKQKRRSQCLLILLIIILLLLIGNAIFLNVRVLSLTNTSPSTSTAKSSLPANTLQCISQFTLNAPTSPSAYPCSTCLSVLEAVPSSYMSDDANSKEIQTINNAVQFCGLRAIFETADAQGQATLGNGSWSQNVNFCTWTGVACDTSSGRVSSLSVLFGRPDSVNANSYSTGS